jgi:hemerythrin-like domain-containing protein
MSSLPKDPVIEDRRRFLSTSALASGLALAGCATTTSSHERAEGKPEGGEAEVTPGEDLMQEHGLLDRILLVYDESARRLDRNEAIDPSVVRQAAELVGRFVQDYHEKLEETFVFPRLQKANKEVDLVAVLLRQHERGRDVTKEILRLTSSTPGPELAQALRRFQRMYRPHAAREDTVLFPAFRSLLSGPEYRELGDQFEDQEHERLGEKGFEGAVVEVARIESALGIGDLESFTP